MKYLLLFTCRCAFKELISGGGGWGSFTYMNVSGSLLLTSGNEMTQHVVACHHAVARICIFLVL